MLEGTVADNDTTKAVIGCAIQVHRALGPGLLESAYRACLAHDLAERHRSVEVGKQAPLVYKGIQIDAAYFVDIVVDGRVLVEVKSVEHLAPVHTSQLLTYLRLLNCPVGLLINFNVTVLKDGIKRVINGRL